MAEIHHSCVNAINCTGKNMSQNLLAALDKADGNKYECSKNLRTGENQFYTFHVIMLLCFIMSFLNVTTLKQLFWKTRNIGQLYCNCNFFISWNGFTAVFAITLQMPM